MQFISSLLLEKCLKEKKERETEEARQTELEREEEFKDYYETNKDKDNSIFNLKGINFIRFTPKRIKFSFQPCRVARLVCKRVMFFVSLRYRKGSWLIKRDSIPANYKRKIYSLFYTNGSFRFHDESIPYGIVEIWRILKSWAKCEDQFRKLKYQVAIFKIQNLSKNKLVCKVYSFYSRGIKQERTFI